MNHLQLSIGEKDSKKRVQEKKNRDGIAQSGRVVVEEKEWWHKLILWHPNLERRVIAEHPECYMPAKPPGDC